MFELLLLVHVLSASVLFGAGTVTALAMLGAVWVGEPELLRTACRRVVRADWLLTLPSGVAQAVTGFALVAVAGDWKQRWVWWGFGLYLLAGACWVPVVWLQIRMEALTEAGARDGRAAGAEFQTLFRIWFALGWPAFAALVAVFWLMVARPG